MADDRVGDAELGRAFDNVYRTTGAITQRLEKVAYNLQSLLELLLEAGTVDRDGLIERIGEVAKRVAQDFTDAGLWVVIHEKHPDKYAIEPEDDRRVDCENRLHLCQGACCRMWFPLSKQDIDEGIVRWDLHQPYRNKKRPDGWCVHQDPETRGCGVYEHRPATCRTYTCRNDPRIWIDFDAYVPNPDLLGYSDPGMNDKVATTEVSLGPTRRAQVRSGG